MLSTLGLNPGGSYSTVTFLAFTLFQLVTLTAYESDRSVFAGNLRVNTIQAALTFGLAVFFALGMAVPEFGALFSFGKLGAAGFAAVAVMTLLTFALHELYKFAASHSPSDRGRKKKGPAEKPKKAPTVKKGSIFGLDDTDDDDSPESDDAGDTSDDISDENDTSQNENETESENDD
ncbi:MAG: cation transporting ATPase C-terminal domain-containing protein [Eubacteriales bacterium]